MKIDKRTFFKFYIFVQIVAVNAIVGGWEAEPYRTTFIKYHLCNIKLWKNDRMDPNQAHIRNPRWIYS